jgi:hypothetical protein
LVVAAPAGAGDGPRSAAAAARSSSRLRPRSTRWRKEWVCCGVDGRAGILALDGESSAADVDASDASSAAALDGDSADAAAAAARSALTASRIFSRMSLRCVICCRSLRIRRSLASTRTLRSRSVVASSSAAASLLANVAACSSSCAQRAERRLRAWSFRAGLVRCTALLPMIDGSVPSSLALAEPTRGLAAGGAPRPMPPTNSCARAESCASLARPPGVS